ncbi:MAG: hypothetical protein MUO97_05485 [Dehalococcoidia bacterium]|nr:hypothetical protein [Dehalococcoidia bacterium]
MLHSDCPDECLKGIPNDNCFYVIGESCVANVELFRFSGDITPLGWIEESVNWKDDDGAVNLTLKQTKTTGELQFKGGIAIVHRVDLDRIKKRYAGYLDYERHPIKGENPYHGNILAKDGTGEIKLIRNQIRSLLADAAEVRPRDSSKLG